MQCCTAATVDMGQACSALEEQGNEHMIACMAAAGCPGQGVSVLQLS